MEKIDFVITWVDGNDKNWQNEKEKFSVKKGIDKKNIRYRDWDNLKYLFRGIEKYASWVNNVYFVTCGQIPVWMNLDNEKLKIVNHSDFIPKEYLPTFSSHPIELNLHRISGLSEHFVYFNDDTFLIDYVNPEDFFRNGLPCEIANDNPISPSGKDVVDYVLFNNTCVINRNFCKRKVMKQNFFKWYNFKYGVNLARTIVSSPWKNFLGYKAAHLPTSLLKSTYEEIWSKEYDIMSSTSFNKFRSKDDVSQYLLIQWQLAKGEFYPRGKKFGKFFNISLNSDLYETITKNKYKTICINDNDFIDDFEKTKDKINICFQKILPEKSSFEK